MAASHNNETTSPWAPSKSSSYMDLVLKPETQTRRLRFAVGQTWVRIVPAFKSSIHNWMMPIHVLNFEGGRFAHPKSLKRNAKSVFDHAYAWAQEHQPELLFSKTNKAGVRLLTDPMSVFWVLHEAEGETVARLFLGSGYDGSRGGVPGLGYQLWRMTKERDEAGNLTSDPVDPQGGLLVCVEKTQPKGAKYPSYGLRLGRQPSPVDSFLAKMAPEEVGALCPLENVIRELTEDEQWICLAKVMSQDIVAQIRSEIQR